MIPVDQAPISEDRRQLLGRFFELTAYGSSDLLSFSSESKLFLMKNGGKYRLVGNEVEHLAGPSPDPSERI